MGNSIDAEIVTEAIVPAPRKRIYLDPDHKIAQLEAKKERQRGFRKGKLSEAQARGLELGREKLAEKRLERKKQLSMDAELFRELSKRDSKEISAAVIQKAKEGDMRAIEFIFDRVDGKAAQHVESNSKTQLHVTFERLG
jgi:hypothetical protein